MRRRVLLPLALALSLLLSPYAAATGKGTSLGGRLLFHGSFAGKPAALPTHLENEKALWIQSLDGGNFLLGMESGVYRASPTQGFTKILEKRCLQYADRFGWDGTYLGEDRVLHWSNHRKKSGTIAEVQHFEHGGGPKQGSLLALKRDGSLALMHFNVEMAWDFDAWASGHRFRDIAMTRWKGIFGVALALTDSGELFAFNREGFYQLPAEISSGILRVSSGPAAINLAVVKENGDLYEFARGVDMEDASLDDYLMRWRKSPRNRFEGRTPVEFSCGHYAKAIRFDDGTWAAFPGRGHLRNPFFEKELSGNKLQSLIVSDGVKDNPFMVAIAAPDPDPPERQVLKAPKNPGITSGEPIPISWSKSRNIKWRVPLEGTGYCSPVVHRGKIFFTSALENEDGTTLLKAHCFDAKNGTVVWSADLFRLETLPVIHHSNNLASPNLICRDNRIFVHFGAFGTACLDCETGLPFWRQTGLTYYSKHGPGGSPTLAGDKMIIALDGAENPCVVALNTNDGSIAWKTPRTAEIERKESYATPLLFNSNGKSQVVVPGAGAVVSYDPFTGKEIWVFRYDGHSLVGQPVFAKGLVILTTGSSKSILAIRADGSGDVTETHLAWEIRQNVGYRENWIRPLFVLDHYLFTVDSYISSSRFIAYEIESGDFRGSVKCNDQAGSDHNSFHVPILYHNDHLLLTNVAGRTWIFDPKSDLSKRRNRTRNFKAVETNDLGSEIRSSLAISDGEIYVRTNKELLCISTRRIF